MRVLKHIALSLIILLSNSSSVKANKVYKYKDDKGQWVFSDKPPIKEVKTEELIYKQAMPEQELSPKIYVVPHNSLYNVVIKNPLYIPIEIEITSADTSIASQYVVIQANQSKTLIESLTQKPDFNYRWVTGDPKAQVDGSVYHFPSNTRRPLKISQSFHGKFSHYQSPNKYAVDIAMPVGTDITAAREGVIVSTKDNFHISGKTRYFVDKANYVKVLHSDGTFATYAHLLQGTVVVSVGDKVNVGDKLARSGSSGYSTGPHLHFVVRKNVGFELNSIPFQFVGENGLNYTPQAGMLVEKQH